MTMSPFQDLITTLQQFVLTQVPGVKNCMEGWQDTKFFQVDANLPGVFFVIPSSRPKESRGRGYLFGASSTTNGQTTDTYVLNKREYMIQAHIVAKTKADCVSIGDALWAALSEQWYLPLQQNSQNTLLTLTDDMMVTTGEETNYHRRVITFGATLRQLSTQTGPGFQQADVTGSISVLTGTQESPSVSFTLDPAQQPGVINFKTNQGG